MGNSACIFAGRRNGKTRTVQELTQQRRDLALFIKGRNEVLLTLDEQLIRAYYAGWGVLCPTDDAVFWASVHKARAQIAALPEQEKAASIAWLAEHGFGAGTHNIQEGRQ